MRERCPKTNLFQHGPVRAFRDDKAKEKAEKIVKKVKGVVSVKNELKLVGSD